MSAVGEDDISPAVKYLCIDYPFMADCTLHLEDGTEVRRKLRSRWYQGNRIWSLRLLKAGSTSWGSGAVNSDRGCRNAEEPASVRSFARRKGSSAVNHLPDFSYAIALQVVQPSPAERSGMAI